jgi:fatty acid desaturase
LATVNAVAIWFWPVARPVLVPLACYFALTAGLVAHNHNHCATFHDRRLNLALNHLATVFYGFAAFNWIPTHNQNHHKFQNALGDATITWRFSNRHNALVAFAYPFVSMVAQIPLIDAYVRKARATKPDQYRDILLQLVICWGLPIVPTLIDWRATVAAIWIPRAFSLYVIIYFNYVQHVHCDPYSEWNHSRSFTGRLTNFLLFNNGFHAVHHMRPGAHWSVLPKLHAEVAHRMDPRVNERSLFLWMVDCYLLAPFDARRGTQQIGRCGADVPEAHLGGGMITDSPNPS